MQINCKSVLIIGDVAGEFETLLELISQSPPSEKIILVGDLNDRGPDSKEVIEWAINNPDIITIDSNHGHMFVDYYYGADIYGAWCFPGNGGMETIKSYNEFDELSMDRIPKSHIDWLTSRPKYVILNDDILITHAPLNPNLTLEEACDTSTWESTEKSVLWNREAPRPRSEYKLQIYGHNSKWNEHKCNPERKNMNHINGLWAVCIDNSHRNELMSLHIPSMKYTRVGYR